MAEVVLYRKWRPQTLAEIAGQEHVVQTLVNALASGRVAHAYFFCGPRGTGKTSTGRILAKALNCLTTGGKGEPCNQCEMCLAVTQGRALDLIEIDAASNRGIDEVRDLREKVRFAPVQARTKVYIIDEAHMLTPPAFNALLKTLEEPPPSTVLVLATTEAHQVPATIISRCQRFDFHRLTLLAIVARLAYICEQEGVESGEEVLRTLARSASGSLRDAINLLDQLTICFGPALELEPVQQLLGLTSDVRARELAAHILRGEVSSGLKALGSASEEGADLRQLHRELVGFLRGVLLAKSGAEEVLDTTREQLQEMKALASSASLDRLLKAIRLLSQTTSGAESYWADGHPTLPLEMVVVESCLSPDGGSSARSGPASGATSGGQRTGASPRPIPPVESMQPRPPSGDPMAQDAPSNDYHAAGLTAPQLAPSPAEAPQLLEHLRGSWKQVVEACKGKGQRFKFDGLFRSAEPVAIEGDTLIISFAFSFHHDKANEELDNPISRRAVEDILARVLGSRLKLRCILSPKPREAKPAPGGHLLEAALEMGARVVEDDS